MQPIAYDSIVSKHSELSGLISKIATENRAPSEEERNQISTLQRDIEAIKSKWESNGRKAFFDSLKPSVEPTKDPLTLKTADKFTDAVKGSYDPEYEALSFGKIVRGYLTGNWDNAPLEMKAMASSPTSAGGILIPTVLSARIIDIARSQSVAFRAGAITVPMTSNNLTMARLTQDVSAGWYAEAGTISESDAAFDSVSFSAKKMATLVRVDNELLEDAENINSVLQQSIGAAIGLALDLAILQGDGTNNTPKGIKNTTNVQMGTAVGTPADYDFLLTAIYGIRGQNFNSNAVAWHSRTAQTLASLKTGLTGDKTPLAMPADVAALAKYVSNQIPTNLGTGTNESYAVRG